MIREGFIFRMKEDPQTHIVYAQVKLHPEDKNSYQVQFALAKGEHGRSSLGKKVRFIPRRDGTGHLHSR